MFIPYTYNQLLAGALAISEAGAGSDVGGLSCTATLDGDHYVVTGAFEKFPGIVRVLVLVGVRIQNSRILSLPFRIKGCDG